MNVFREPNRWVADEIRVVPCRWESEEDQLAFEASPIYRELMGKLAGTIAATPVNAGYEVSVQA